MTKTNRHIYLDYNATAPLKPAARTAMLAALEEPCNPSAVHKPGRGARMHVENARKNIAATLNCHPENIIFTSGATEANNTVILNMCDLPVYISAIEHPSVYNAIPNEDRNYLPVNEDGIIKLDLLEERLAHTKTPFLVSIMAVNNETGVIQPIRDISRLVRKYKGYFHCDAVQAYTRMPLDVMADEIDFLSLSGHKIGAPLGIGALVVGPDIDFYPLLMGGGQEKNRRAGTENTPAIAGFGAIAAMIDDTMADFGKLELWRDKIEKALSQHAPELIIHGKNTPRIANTTMFSLPGIASDTQMINMDLAGFAVSNGSACSSGRVEPSHVLKAMGKSDAEATSALRISLGWQTEEKDIDAFIQSWKDVYDRVKSRL